MRLLIAALLLLAAIAHITYNLRYAYASFFVQQDTPAALRRAAQLTPADAAIYARLAALDRDHSTQWIDTALKLNPTNAILRIERAVNAEVSGNPDAAEASLLEAARLDHQYIPRWTLAAFYYRQRDLPKFRIWARQALEMAWGDALPLFQMATQLGMSSDDIRRTMLPDRAPVLAAFVSECLRRKDFEEARRSARRLIEIGTKDTGRATVLAAIDALFDSGLSSGAVELWNQAAAAHWFPHPAIGPPITNPDFSFEFLPAGFDWRPSVLDGVVYWRLGNGRGLQFEFSGRQPESCILLTLRIPFEPGKHYKLRTKASGFNAGMGLKWRLGTEEWDVVTEEQTIEDPQPLQLMLTYNRALGTKRIEGALTLYRVEVTP
jgi:tetratricopeptide (TPR) repeat protein